MKTAVIEFPDGTKSKIKYTSKQYLRDEEFRDRIDFYDNEGIVLQVIVDDTKRITFKG